jgi:hypothetical protein
MSVFRYVWRSEPPQQVSGVVRRAGGDPMRPTVRRALIGAGVALLGVVAFGAVRGALFGHGDDYALNRTGLDGASLGAILFAVFGGLPALLIGAAAGVAVGSHRDRTPAPPAAGRASDRAADG